MIKELLEKETMAGFFTIESARRLSSCDWRSLVQTLPFETKRDAEDLFYFIEGFVEEFDEGFVSERDDPELYERAKALMSKL
jgi:hypothetical protein